MIAAGLFLVHRGSRITHSILLNGFDIKFKRWALYERVRGHVIATAEAVDRKCLEVSANLKSFGTKYTGWKHYGGAFLPSVGLALLAGKEGFAGELAEVLRTVLARSLGEERRSGRGTGL